MPTESPIRVAAIVRNEKAQVLLVHHFHRGSSFWTLPGGGLNELETPQDAVTREVAEETGHSIVLDGLAGMGVLRKDRWEQAKVGLFFCARSTSVAEPRAEVGEKILEARFFDVTTIPASFRPRETLMLLDRTALVPCLELTFVEDDA